MNTAGQVFKRFLLVVYLLFIHTLAASFVLDRFIAPFLTWDNSLIPSVKPPMEETPIPTPIPVPSIPRDDVNPPPANSAASNVNLDRGNLAIPTSPFPQTLMIPVVGVTRDQLYDSFSDVRSEGRFHDAIDIMAPEGTPVVATADGEIARFFDSEMGGVTIYQFSVDKRYVFYYAHLQKRAENIREKEFVRQGTVIGYVGDTGNAGAGNYHLHFAIFIPNAPDRYWDGVNVNPFPLLKNGLEAR